MNPLRRYFRANTWRMIHKWDHYFDIYDRHFRRYRGADLTMVEVGVSHGGSLQMWRKYFGRRARIVGVDIDGRTRNLAEPGIEIFIGDQSDRRFLSDLARRVGTADIILDDGGHMMDQQLVTFDELWPIVVDGGLYAVEDLHTSYWDAFDGGLDRPGTFIEFSKRAIDRMHAWHVPDGALKPDALTRSVRGMHVYDSLIVFDKDTVAKPYHERTGHPVFPLEN